MRTASTLLQQAEIRRDEALDRVVRSQQLAYRAWQRIAVSRRRIETRRAIAGASTNEVHAARKSIRARLADGTLPRFLGPAWAGRARGDHRCACCHEVICAPSIEYESRDRLELYADLSCFMVWVSESYRALAGSRCPPVKMSGARSSSFEEEAI